jgi:peptide-methionine (S)-S-oxide reductase
MQKLAMTMLLAISLMACGQNQLNSDLNDQNKNEEGMDNLEVATLGAGCFWCVEAIFQNLEGVEKVESGYSGGSVKNPAYREVCNGTTGHAEVVQVYFHPDKISFAEILEVFFETHNPTTLNKQGADVGTQYRSAIFFRSPEQEQIANTAIAAANESGNWADPIVTEVTASSIQLKIITKITSILTDLSHIVQW